MADGMSKAKSRRASKTAQRNKGGASSRKLDNTQKRKALKLAKHLATMPWDNVARTAFNNLPAHARKGIKVADPVLQGPAKNRKDLGLTLTAIKKMGEPAPQQLAA